MVDAAGVARQQDRITLRINVNDSHQVVSLEPVFDDQQLLAIGRKGYFPGCTPGLYFPEHPAVNGSAGDQDGRPPGGLQCQWQPRCGGLWSATARLAFGR